MSVTPKMKERRLGQDNPRTDPRGFLATSLVNHQTPGSVRPISKKLGGKLWRKIPLISGFQLPNAHIGEHICMHGQIIHMHTNTQAHKKGEGLKK